MTDPSDNESKRCSHHVPTDERCTLCDRSPNEEEYQRRLEAYRERERLYHERMNGKRKMGESDEISETQETEEQSES